LLNAEFLRDVFQKRDLLEVSTLIRKDTARTIKMIDEVINEDSRRKFSARIW